MQINSVGQWHPSWTSRGQRVWTHRLQCPADVCTCPGRVGNQSSHIKKTGGGAEMFAMQFESTRGLSYTRLSQILASWSVFDLWWFFWLCYASFYCWRQSACVNYQTEDVCSTVVLSLARAKSGQLSTLLPQGWHGRRTEIGINSHLCFHWG